MVTIGIDEVGRGCWAGPLVAGAVILETALPGLRDSKKLSRARREELAVAIYEAGEVSLGWVAAWEIDAVGLSKAVGLAMERALTQIGSPYDELIVDGNINYFASNQKARAIVKADDHIPAVSAASIVAKVARDKYMRELGEKYAGYGFEQHVGYGTAAHLVALEKLGVSDIHRLCYKPIKALLA